MGQNISVFWSANDLTRGMVLILDALQVKSTIK